MSFTEGGLSGWRSPPLPRLSAQTQTAPVQTEEKKGRRRNESFSVCKCQKCHHSMIGSCCLLFSPDPTQNAFGHRLEVKVNRSLSFQLEVHPPSIQPGVS